MAVGSGRKLRNRRRLRNLAAIAALGCAAVAVSVTDGSAETVTGDNLAIRFVGSIDPQVLPRSTPGPAALHVEGTVRALNEERPVGLDSLTIQINRHAHLSVRGLPSCKIKELVSTDSKQALKNCGMALVGSGSFQSHIDIPDQAPFPASGRVLVFNVTHGRVPRIALHVFGLRPTPTSLVLSAEIRRTGPSSGTLGPQFTVQMPDVGEEWGYVTGFDLSLNRRYRYRGRQRSVVTANCPAPDGFDTVPFTAARATFDLRDGRSLTRTVTRTCHASAD